MTTASEPAGQATFTVNGISASVPGDATLLSALRDRLRLTGAKLGCGEGACGACTVLLDDKPVRSCQRTSASVAGQQVTTIEGIAGPGAALHPVQQAFALEGAAQCGYCTPGMILTVTALLAADPDPDDAAVDAALAGQICRCGTYPRIRRAVHRAAGLSNGAGAVLTGGGAASAGSTIVAQAPDGGPDGDRWGPPVPSTEHYRPTRPWDMTEPEDRDYFGALGDGLVVVLNPPPPGQWNTSQGAWLHVSADGVVTAFTGKVDVGQDNRTALRLLVAEELGVPVGRVRLAMGDTDVCPYDMGTFGSRSMPDAGAALRTTASYARTASPVRPGERRLEIVTGEPTLVPPASWQQAGRPHLPPGAVAAVTGARQFVSDLDHSGLWHGAVLRPPAPDAVLRSVDPAAVTVPGAVVVRTPELAGVVAAGQAAASAALDELRAAATWDIPDAPSDSGLADYLRRHPTQGSPGGRWGGPFLHQEGSAATALESAALHCEATYTAAYIAPAALETRTAVAAWDDDGRVTVWTGTQTPFPVRAQVAAALAIDEHDVRIVVPATGGGFGGKHAGGISAEAAILAREVSRPVRVHWSRSEEFTAGTLRPAAVIDVAAGVTAAGTMSGWSFTNVNSGAPGISVPYLVADQRLEYIPAASPLPQASYRALAATANNFARESMIDELARLVGADPVEFRLRNLGDDRLAAVLRAVAEHVGWEADRDPIPGLGVGVACGLEKDGRVVTVAQVAVGRDRRVRVAALVTGYECGAVVNPETVRNQIEGAAVMALGGAMFEEIRFTDGVITNGAFSSYRVPRIGDVPPVEVLLLNRPDLPSAGAGETPMIAIAPAIANAICDATGQRLRSLPLTSDGLLPGT